MLISSYNFDFFKLFTPGSFQFDMNFCWMMFISLVFQFPVVARNSLNERLYSCPWEGCQRTLTMTKLRRHYRTHSGERPFKCPVCDYCASRLDSLRRHCKARHALSGLNAVEWTLSSDEKPAWVNWVKLLFVCTLLSWSYLVILRIQILTCHISMVLCLQIIGTHLWVCMALMVLLFHLWINSFLI